MKELSEIISDNLMWLPSINNAHIAYFDGLFLQAYDDYAIVGDTNENIWEQDVQSKHEAKEAICEYLAQTGEAWWEIAVDGKSVVSHLEWFKSSDESLGLCYTDFNGYRFIVWEDTLQIQTEDLTTDMMIDVASPEQAKQEAIWFLAQQGKVWYDLAERSKS